MQAELVARAQRGDRDAFSAPAHGASTRLYATARLIIDPMAWGDPAAQADVWAAHDPVDRAEALRGKPVYLSWQDGQPGPLDPPGTTADSYGLEAWVAPQNEALAAKLEELGIPVTVETGSGAHEWPYWEQGLHRALPTLLEVLEE